MLALLAGVLLLAPLPAPPPSRTGQDPAPPPEPAAIEASIEASIAVLVAAARAGDGRAFAAAWDFERMLDHVRELVASGDGFLEPGSPHRVTFLRAVQSGLGARSADLAWEAYEVLRVDVEPQGGGATALLRVRQPAGYQGRIRLWLVRSGLRWKVWDVEDVTGGLRSTTLMVPALAQLAAIAEGSDDRGGPWLEQVGDLVAGLQALGAADLEGVQRALDATQAVEFPLAFEAIHLLLQIGLDVGEGRFAQALVRLETGPAVDLAVLDYLAAVAHNGLGQSEQALAYARRFVESVGDDAEGRLEEGIALMALERPGEALAAFRAGLDEDPRGLELLIELGCALPSGEKAELGQRLVASGDPGSSFEPVVVELLYRGEREAAEAWIAALREALPGDPNADYYAAELLAEEGRHAAAAALLLGALPRVGDPGERSAYEAAYLGRMTDAGRPLEGYERLDGSDFAFEELATLLAWNGNGAALLELVRTHGEHRPEHPDLALTRGRALALLERRAEAEEAFAEAMGRATAHELEQVRYERVANLFEAGEWRRAYAQVPPAEATLEDLAWAFQDAGDADGLEALVALHSEASGDPDGPQLARWSAEAAWLRGQYARALELLLAHEPKVADPDGLSTLYFWEDRVVRCLLRLGRLEEATGLAMRIDQRDDDPFYIALAQAAAGRGEQAVAALERLLATDAWQAWELYEDEDFGPLLRAEGAAALRAVAPPPDPGTGR